MVIQEKYMYPFQLERLRKLIDRKLPCREEHEISYQTVKNGILLPVKKINKENLFGSGGGA